MSEFYEYSADEALLKLKNGNQEYTDSHSTTISSSREILLKAYDYGQQPYAIIVTCSDSRVIPEIIFSAGIGDLFVIRVAGNVIDDHQLGSIEYAADHLGTGLVLVLGHTRCGAVDAALHHSVSGYVKYIVDDISEAIGDEKDELEACRLNVRHSCTRIENSLNIQKDEKEHGLKVLGAVYHLEDGTVEFL